MLLLLARPIRTLSSEDDGDVSMERCGTLSVGEDRMLLMAVGGEVEAADDGANGELAVGPAAEACGQGLSRGRERLRDTRSAAPLYFEALSEAVARDS